MDWHEKQLNQILKHANAHRSNTHSRTNDLSCRICYPIDEESMNERFGEFWKWYQDITSAERFSAKTQETFEELMRKNSENILEGKENPRINALIYSVQYRNNSRSEEHTSELQSLAYLVCRLLLEKKKKKKNKINI